MASLCLKTAAVVAFSFCVPQALLADNDLGIIGAELRLGASNHALEGGFGGGTVDVAITPYHGAQFDLNYEERSTGGIGRAGMVLYMTPHEGQKYGLSLMVGDKNDASATYGQIGAVGMLEVAPGLNLELRASAGLSADNDMDWVTAGAGLHWQATPATRVYAHYDLTEFDEAQFEALSHDVTVGVQARISDSPASFFAEASRDWLTGRNAAPAEATLRAGLSISLGHSGNSQPSFRMTDPMRPLLRRGLF